jgi:hypothetical protein
MELFLKKRKWLSGNVEIADMFMKGWKPLKYALPVFIRRHTMNSSAKIIKKRKILQLEKSDSLELQPEKMNGQAAETDDDTSECMSIFFYVCQREKIHT